MNENELTPKQKSQLAYGLAATTLLISAVLAGLKVLSGEDWIKLTLTVWGFVTAYHAASPGQPQQVIRVALPFLALGLVACSPSGGGSMSVSLLSFGGPAPVVRPAAEHRALATSITPITNVSGGASGFLYGGESYEVACSVSGSVTLYPAVYDASVTAWEVYQGYPCALSDAVASEGACIFPARQGGGLTWNAFKTGAGTVSACTAAGRQGPVPAGRSSSSGGGGSGVTDVTATSPLASSGGATPDISLSGIVGQANGGTGADLTASAINQVWATPPTGAAGPMVLRKVVSADITAVVTAGTCTSCSLTYNAQGQITVAASGSGGGGSAFFDTTVQYPTGIDPLGNYSVGGRFIATKDISITGIRFRRYTSPGTITVKVWSGGVELASASVVAASPPDLYTATFVTPVALTGGTVFYCTQYDGGTRYARSTAASWEPASWTGAFFTPSADGVLLSDPGQYAAGDAQPTTGSSVERFPVEPIL